MTTSSTPGFTRWITALVVATVGVTWQYSSLAIIERLETQFPSVPDIIMDHLPRVDFGIFGELWFFGLILCFAIPHFRRQWQRTPEVIIAIGLMYFIRGCIMFVFPIGMPADALTAAERLSVWGYESHAYFPGGHIALLTILAMFTRAPKIRAILWVGLMLFGIGTLLSKNHYTADSMVGIMLGYVCAIIVQRHLTRVG